MNIIEECGNLSGLKLNKNKTEGIWLGRLKHTKDKYDAGNTCLIPRKTIKGAGTHPLLRIHPFISVYIVRIHLINELLKPNCSRHSVIKDHSKESNAFVKSR
jgi:hypothetical protein